VRSGSEAVENEPEAQHAHHVWLLPTASFRPQLRDTPLERPYLQLGLPKILGIEYADFLAISPLALDPVLRAVVRYVNHVVDRGNGACVDPSHRALRRRSCERARQDDAPPIRAGAQDRHCVMTDERAAWPRFIGIGPPLPERLESAWFC
jgi:hypothetical protein